MKEKIRAFLGGLKGVGDAQITEVIDVSKIKLENDGLQESNSHFNVALAFYAGHLLEQSGVTASLSSKSFGDVNVSYAQSNMSWLSKYRMAKQDALGRRGRLA